MINVFSEVGVLKKVLLHRPGKALENITPETKNLLLFDDIPFLKIAQEEHDYFANLLKSRNVEVIYIEKLLTEVISSSLDIKEKFIRQFLAESKIYSMYLLDALLDYLINLKDEHCILQIIAGIRTSDINLNKLSFTSIANKLQNFFCAPMPNLLFTRDNFASIGNGATLNTMFTSIRNRECILAEYLFAYHPDFKNTHLYYNRFENGSIEGGDILILSKNILAIGLSERTDALAIEKFANRILNSNNRFKKILVFNIPKKRAFMHLDTVFTQIDIDKFTIHPEAESCLEVFSITKDTKELNIKEEKNTLKSILSKELNIEAKILKCGGDDPIASAREQWSDGSNTLAIAPNEIIVYNRNHVTNTLLKDNGVIVHEIPSSELSRGRGGPRCMSMPINRLDLNNE